MTVIKNRVATKFDRQNSRIIQGCFKDIFVIFNTDIPNFKIKLKDLSRISRIGIKFKDFKDFFKDVATLKNEKA